MRQHDPRREPMAFHAAPVPVPLPAAGHDRPVPLPAPTASSPATVDRPLVAIAGGGTGGHLIPGINLARALSTDCDLIFYSTGKPLEDRLIDGAGFGRVALPAVKLPTSPMALPFALPVAGVRAMHALWRSHRRIGAERPAVVVGLGGFGAAAPVLAAWMRGIPTVLLEQNVIPGRANRLLARVASEVHLQWDEAREHMTTRPGARMVWSGSPLRDGVAEAGAASSPTRDDLERFGLEAGRVTLLVTGGSQGARSLNEMVAGAVTAMSERVVTQLQVLHLAGKNTDLVGLRDAYAAAAVPHAVLEFLDDMPAAYRVADAVVARAGGTTLAELAAAGLPAILLPYPHAANRHQHANARAFCRQGGGVVLDEEGLVAARLARELEAMLGDRMRLHEMAQAAHALGRPAAAHDIGLQVMALAARGQR